MNSLKTDLYQLTMAAGYLQAGKASEKAVFELFVRRMPPNRDFLIAAGLQQAIEYLLELRFTSEQVDYLRSLEQFELVQSGFWDYLREFRFTGDVFAMREGTPFYPGEPVLTVHAPIIEAQIPETFLLSMIGFQSNIASKAARIVSVARGRPVIEFGTRRAHGPDAGVFAGRAGYIGGCSGTSNVEAAFRFGIPVFGTSAHSWIQAFPAENSAFKALQQLLGSRTTYLIDTYDTVRAAHQVAKLGAPLAGVRLDSGNLDALSRSVRQVLDEAGLSQAKIMASGDLDEHRIAALVTAKAPIDSFGVGTQLATSADAPSLSAVYKLVELDLSGIKRYTAKYSSDKQTLPGAKQVFRYPDRDVVGCSTECAPGKPGDPLPEALLRPVMLEGRLLDALPSAAQAREYCIEALSQTAGGRRVEHSDELLRLAQRHEGAGRLR
ncbi:MAG: nicotinate phosphoribosyltransferase [Bryobacteraceae bacterium]